jgi:hypothetical protein
MHTNPNPLARLALGPNKNITFEDRNLDLAHAGQFNTQFKRLIEFKRTQLKRLIEFKRIVAFAHFARVLNHIIAEFDAKIQI